MTLDSLAREPGKLFRSNLIIPLSPKFRIPFRPDGDWDATRIYRTLRGHPAFPLAFNGGIRQPPSF